MMSEEDLKEYHNIEKQMKQGLKINKKYNYVSGTQHTDQGSRTYDINGSRLPSVTTILGKTKAQKFLKDWTAKVG